MNKYKPHEIKEELLREQHMPKHLGKYQDRLQLQTFQLNKKLTKEQSS